MDSPYASQFFYQNNFILLEEAIFSSQQTLSLLDIEDEKMQKALELLVVTIDEEQKEEASSGIVLEGKNQGIKKWKDYDINERETHDKKKWKQDGIKKTKVCSIKERG